jgi:hypothetical protein
VQKVAAIAATGIVLVSGAAITSLAAWTDTEWVQGGVGTIPGISTSTFQMQQNTTTGTTGWVDEPESPGGIIAFVDASGLTPGDTAYGFVRLRTTATSVDGMVSMFAATHATGDDLYDALEYGAGFVLAPGDCDETGFTVANLVAFGSPLATDATLPFSIDGAAASERIVCFAVTLPDGSPDTLQGASTTPEWYFEAESN